MSELQATPETRLWTPQGFRQDEWSHAADAEALAGGGRVILPLEALLALDPERRAHAGARLGVLLQPGEPLQALAGLLGRLSLVALAFPVFTDGRSYSKAELLRRRHGFGGAVRAVGQILLDQLPHMLRVGFTEFEVSDPALLKRLQAGGIGGLPLHRGPAARSAGEGGGYAWRRTPA